jgi:hypothetical protein
MWHDMEWEHGNAENGQKAWACLLNGQIVIKRLWLLVGISVRHALSIT